VTAVAALVPTQLSAARVPALALARPPGVLLGAKPLSASASLRGRVSHAEAFFVVYGATTSLSALEAAVVHGQLGSPLAITRAVALAPGARSIRLAVPDPIPSSGCQTACSGVYPVQLRVASSQTGQTLASITFAVPYLSQTTGIVPVGVAAATVVSVPGVGPASLATLLARDPQAAVAIAATRPGALAAVRSLAGSVPRRSLLLAPYAELPAGCFGALGPLTGVGQALGLGSELTGAGLGAAVFTSTPTEDGLRSAAARASLGVLVPAGGLAAAAPVLSLTQPVVLGNGVRVLGISQLLSAQLAQASSPGAAQLLDAELAQIYFEAPSVAGRVLALAVPVGSDRQVAALAHSIAALDELPFVDSEGVQAALTAPAARLRRLAEPGRAACAPVGRALRSAAARLGALAAAAPSLAPAASATLLGALAAPSARALALAEARSLLSDLSISSDQLTLTSAHETVPIGLSSRVGAPATVRIVLADSKLRFPGGATRLVTITGRTTTIAVPVQARTLGTSPLTVRLESPSGSLIATKVIVVDSTGFSVVGVVLTASALALLGWWWARNLLRRPRGRHAQRRTR